MRDLQAKVDSVHSEQSKDKTLISDLSIKVDNLEKQNGNLKKPKLREALNERLVCQESHANRINDLNSTRAGIAYEFKGSMTVIHQKPHLKPPLLLLKNCRRS